MIHYMSLKEFLLSEVTLYHGSKQPIEKWDSSKHLSGYYPGFYTWNDPNKATSHGSYVYKLDLNNPKLYNLTNSDELKKQAKIAGFSVTMGSGYQDVQYLKSLGYDGIIRGNEYIIFNPEKWSVEPMMLNNHDYVTNYPEPEKELPETFEIVDMPYKNSKFHKKHEARAYRKKI